MTDSQASVLAAGGLANAGLIVEAADRTGVPLAIAAAMVEKESGGRNVYGHDTGGAFSVPGRDIEVTQENYKEFLRRVLAGEKSNGVGPAQITYRGYFERYPEYPFWEPLANIRFGLTVLADYLNDDFSDASISSAAARYNGGTNPGPRALAYGADLLTKTNAWRAKLAGASDIGGGGMDWANLEPDLYRLMNVHYTSGRAGKSINKIVLHHNGGTLTTEQCYQVWQTREASAHYQVEITGRIGQLVNDSDTAWHAGDLNANQTSIGIEHANNALAPNWTVSDATLDAGAHLVAAICRYYGLGRPVWGQNVFGHKNFYATDCPGALAGAQNAAYMARASYYYDNLTGGTPSDTTTAEEEDIMSPTETTALLGTIAERLLVVSDALTVGKEGVKYDGDVIARLRAIESKIDALAAPAAAPAEPEPVTPVEPAPVDDKAAIKAKAAALVRAAADAIDAL